MFLRRLFPVVPVLALVAALVGAACGGDGDQPGGLPGDQPTSSSLNEGGNSPEAAVQLLLDGIATADQDKVLDATDPAYRNQPVNFFSIDIVSRSVISILTGVDVSQQKVSFRDVKFRTVVE